LGKFIENESAGDDQFEDVFPEDLPAERLKFDRDFLDTIKEYYRDV